MRQEAELYKHYLEEQMQKEADDEMFLNRLREEETEKEWQKRMSIWEKEKREREQLMKEVMAERENQIAIKCVCEIFILLPTLLPCV